MLMSLSSALVVLGVTVMILQYFRAAQRFQDRVDTWYASYRVNLHSFNTLISKFTKIGNFKIRWTDIFKIGTAVLLLVSVVSLSLLGTNFPNTFQSVLRITTWTGIVVFAIYFLMFLGPMMVLNLAKGLLYLLDRPKGALVFTAGAVCAIAGVLIG